MAIGDHTGISLYTKESMMKTKMLLTSVTMAGMLMVGIAVDQLYHRWTTPPPSIKAEMVKNVIQKESKQIKRKDAKKDKRYHT